MADLGPVIGFFGGTHDASKYEAIEYVRKNNWTSGDVKIILHESAYLVIAKRRLW